MSLGNYQKALETYKDIHRKFPENVECTHQNFYLLYTDSLWSNRNSSYHLFPCRAGLRFLVRLCTDMGLKEVQDYATKLKKVEKMKEIREQVLCSCFYLNVGFFGLLKWKKIFVGLKSDQKKLDPTYLLKEKQLPLNQILEVEIY